MATCPRCGEESPDGAQLCSFCGSPLGHAPPARRKVATVLFCDMTGSTALGERLDPEALRDVMFRYFHDMRTAIERHGGTVEKYIGDAVMAVFGVPTTHEDDALRAVRAASEMQASLAVLNEELRQRFGDTVAVRIGVNTGEVVTSDLGEADPSAGTIVTGDTVNVAARLEQAAPPGGVLLGERTWRAARRALTAEPMDPLDLKGKSEPVPAYRLTSLKESAEPRRSALAAGMVGREDDLAELERAFAQCREERRARLVTVVGEAGVGKSRLVAEFLRSVEREARALSGRCPSYGEGVTYWPLAEVIRQATAAHGETADGARARVAGLLEGEADAERVSELICTAVGLGDCAASPEGIAWGARRVLETLAAERPVVVVLDDLQWAQPVFLDLVETLASRSRGAPILVLCVARPGLFERRPQFGGDTTIRLAPLGASESTGLIEGLLGDACLPPETQARVAEVAGGNPLFIEELLAALIDDGTLRRQDGAWTAVGDLARIEIPPTLEALLGSRLDRLDREQRAAVERASVEGQVFHEDALRALSPAEGEMLPETLEELDRKQLICSDAPAVAGDAAFRFRHLLIRDAAYRGVAKRTRAHLHEHLADWLEQAARGRIAEHEEVIGYHLEQAYRYRTELGTLDDEARALGRRAAERLGVAGRRALLTRGDAPAAVNLLERARALVADDDPRRAGLEADLAAALERTGEPAPASPG